MKANHLSLVASVAVGLLALSTPLSAQQPDARLPLAVGGSSPYAADCAKSTYGALTKEQAIDLCRTATAYTADCVSKAYGPLTREQTLDVCRIAAPETGNCVAKAYGSFTSEEVVRLCTGRRLP